MCSATIDKLVNIFELNCVEELILKPDEIGIQPPPRIINAYGLQVAAIKQSG
jgi:hypothetical protein